MQMNEKSLMSIVEEAMEKKEEHTQKTQKVSGHILVIDDDTMKLVKKQTSTK